ncbi:MAG TPA: hypothetical protein VL131_10105 [Gammaproteobacteria bacterium]|nr:hypothetical protein [Gammaproteobacteria bacterium]
MATFATNEGHFADRGYRETPLPTQVPRNCDGAATRTREVADAKLKPMVEGTKIVRGKLGANP